MATPLILLCAGATAMSRTGGFAAPGEPLDEGGRKDAACRRIDARFRGDVRISPMRCAAETAQAMGLAAREEAALADSDHGLWAGRGFAELYAEMPGEMAAWLADPTAAVPGGESLEAVRDRAGRWLDGIADAGRPICAVTHASVIRAALAHALGLPLTATLAIDIAPLCAVTLSFNRVWRLQSLVPAD